MRFKDNTAPVVPEAPPASVFELELPSAVHDVPFDEGVLLRLNQSAMRRLDSLVREGLGTASEVEGVEVGGILIGAVARDRSMVTLVDVAPIKLDRRSGPGFRPSEIDLRGFADAISQESKGLRHVIGYFRSELDAGDTVSLRTEDENLLRRFFADGFCTFILAGAARHQPVTASICNWKSGEEVRVVERLQLVTTPVANPVRVPNPVPVEAPVEAKIPGVAPQPVPTPIGRPAPKPAPAAALPKREPQPTLVPPPVLRPQTYPGLGDFGQESILHRFKKTLIAAAAATVLLVAFALGRFSAPRKPIPDPRLDLNVEVHDLIAEVKWDPSTPVMRDSESAALDILDGADVSRIELNPAQVRAGHYVFVPHKPDLTFVMTVYRKQNAFVGATRKVHLDLAQTSTNPESPAQASLLKPATTPAPATASKQIDAQKTGGEKSEIKTVASDPGPKQPDKAVPARAPSFTPPPRVAASTPTPRLEDAPALATPKSSPAASPLPVTAILSANSAFIPGSSGEAGTQSPAAGSASSAFSQAVPIKRVSPIAPLAGTLTIRQEVSIRVSMLVDQYGQVTEAHALDVEDVMKRTLAPLALEAARRWQFDPARKAGVPVPSQTIVIFQFAKNI